MQQVKRKQHKPLRHARLLMMLGLILLLGACVAVWYVATRPEETPEQDTETQTTSGGTLYAYAEADVASLRITLRSGESWLMTQSEDGTLAVDGDTQYPMADDVKASLLNAVSMVTYQDMLTEDASAYEANFADFGLDTPRVVAEISYRDGTQVTLRIGNSHALEEYGWSYMMVDGDPCLYALDNGTADDLNVKKASLMDVEQPTLHKARFDSITLTDAQGNIQAQWTLQGDIGGDADDRWLLTAPLTYPAEGESMSNLKDNLTNLRLGAYVAEATAENLTLYGFDAPRFRIDIHMVAGSIGTTNSDGQYEVTDWDESTFTLTVGSAKSDNVDYVRVEDRIYLTSHFTLQVFMDMDPANTLTRYVVPAALGNLAELRIATDSGEDVYTITRTEQVAENNDLVYDEDGNVVYDITCSKNGAAMAYSSFEASYNELLMVTVSGKLADGWTGTAPHTCYTFTQTDGTVHTVELADYDAFHDAVSLDGNTLFYLIKGGMAFKAE